MVSEIRRLHKLAPSFRPLRVSKKCNGDLSSTDLLPQFLKSLPPAVTDEGDEAQCDPHGPIYVHQAMITRQHFYRHGTSRNNHDQRLGRNDDCSAYQQNPKDSGYRWAGVIPFRNEKTVEETRHRCEAKHEVLCAKFHFWNGTVTQLYFQRIGQLLLAGVYTH
jgi:hypothetical protein